MRQGYRRLSGPASRAYHAGMPDAPGTLESVAIRRGEPADRDALAALIAANGAGGRHRTEELAHLLSSREHFIYLAETEAPFGFVGAGPADEAITGPGAGELVALYLHPQFHGQGMGKKLLVRGLSVLKRRGFERSFAFVPAASVSAVSVFRAIGFEPMDGVEREINEGASTVRECGYSISLEDFF